MSAKLPSPPNAEAWLESLPVAVLGLDADDRIVLANSAAKEMFATVGWTLLKRHCQDVFGEGSGLAALARRARETDAEVAESDVVVAGPGFSLGRMGAAANIVGEQGHVTLILTRAARPRPAPTAVGNSAARTLAHEVRNPLAGIRAAAQLIERGADGEAAGLARLICDEVDRMRRLTDRIDPLAALDAPRMAAFNVHEALERVRALAATSAPGVRLRERYDPSLPFVRGDRDQIIQALLNIVNNAVEVLAERADAEIELATAYRPGVRFRHASQEHARAQLEVQITDNGPGFHPDVAERLFEAFATTKPGGMGLGLTVAADIVAKHGGRIAAEREQERTVFRVFLPIDEGERT